VARTDLPGAVPGPPPAGAAGAAASPSGRQRPI